MDNSNVERPLILVTNDDGVYAKGLNALVEVLHLFGDLLVVAPDSARSGTSHAITANLPIRLKMLQEGDGLAIYSCSGTPVDCVKLAFSQLCADRKPDFVISGINHGANTSVSVIYSGTMGAAIEGCVHAVPSVGFSLCDFSPEADFSRSKVAVARIFQELLENGLPQGVCLNVNIPKGEIKGIKLCRQAHGKWEEEFEARKDPQQRDYFWLTGYFKNYEPDNEHTDEFALANGYVSSVPISIDMTAYKVFDSFNDWKIW